MYLLRGIHKVERVSARFQLVQSPSYDVYNMAYMYEMHCILTRENVLARMVQRFAQSQCDSRVEGLGIAVLRVYMILVWTRNLRSSEGLYSSCGGLVS